MSETSKLKVLLFDLGGVLLRLNDPIEIFGLDMKDSAFKDRWLRSPTVRSFESSKMSIEEFARKIVNEMDLPYGWEEFIERFDTWPDRLFDHTIGMLDAIPASYSRALLSNINALHWGRNEIAGMISPHIDRTFLSFKTGLVKPDRQAFELVTNTYECRPEEVLFFDDSQSSVSAAADFGMHAVLAAGIDTVRKTLAERGILD